MIRSSLAVLLLALTLSACDSSSGPDPITCTLNAGQTLVSPFSSDSFSVLYAAQRTGDGAISTLSYRNSAGDVVQVRNPSLPWSKTESMEPGAEALFTASGQVTEGSLDITMTATNAGGTVNGSDSCAQTAS